MPEEIFDLAKEQVKYVAYVWDGYDGSTSNYGLFSSLEDARCYAIGLLEKVSDKYWKRPDSQVYHFAKALDLESETLIGKPLTKNFLCQLIGLDEIRLTKKIGNYLEQFSEFEEAEFCMHVIIENREGEPELNISSELAFSWESGFHFDTWEC